MHQPPFVLLYGPFCVVLSLVAARFRFLFFLDRLFVVYVLGVESGFVCGLLVSFAFFLSDDSDEITISRLR